MMTYTAQRVGAMLLTLLATSFVIYATMQLVPGDPVIAMFFPNIPPPERVEVIREQLGLNKPFIVRYAIWLKCALQGD
ncbi:MAG: hypothetical protein QXT77_06520, partial [Candidatus Methanomethylicaceae archaeon]